MAPGSLDPSFGTGGIARTTFAGGSFPFVQGTARIGNNIVAVGVAQNSGGKGLFGLARYRWSGSTNSGFGSGGKVTTDFGLGGDNLAAAVAVEPNGSIVVVGYAADHSDTNYYWAVARYRSNGTLDPTFGNQGRVVTTFGLTYDFANAVAIRPDGKIVVAGSVGTHNGTQLLAVARYNSNGSLDYTFGAGGEATTQVNGATLSIGHGLVLSGNDAVVAGYSGSDFSNTQPVLVAYASNGSLESTFGVGGIESFSLGAGGNAFNAIALDGASIIAAGENAASNNGDFFVAKVATNGSPVAGFGTGGTVNVDFAGAIDTAYALGADGSGRIVVAGDSLGASDQVALARLTSTGSLDTTFGSGGEVTTAAGPGGSAAYAMTIMPGPRIVVGGIGLSASQSTSSFILARYFE